MSAFPRWPLILALVALTTLALAGEIPREQRRSGYEQMSPATRAMQDDETANPGLLWLLDGEALWKAKPNATARACADCHGDARTSMKGVAARHPAFDATLGATVNLEGRINICRIEQQQTTALAYDSKELLGLSAWVTAQSKGLPIVIDAGKLATEIAAGKRLFELRQGQLNLSCAQCHDDNWGRKLAGNTIPQGHPTGYPQYRLEWQTVGSLHRRLRNCLTGMRAENFAAGSPELIALESYLMWRAEGMVIESPAVRP
ncbi:MAG: sulfur oxidation c-type cytochrome SoxA [Hyphomicrobiaceae bacterium]